MRSERNALKNGEPTVGGLLHSNVPAYWSVYVKDFLAKNNVTTLELPPYSPDMAPASFYLFPRPIKQICRNGDFVILLTSFRMRRKS